MRRTIVLLSAGLLAFSLAVPGAVMAAPGHYYLVSKPNGTDDTANIQAALDWCAAHGPDCTVQLRAGTYHTSQLVEDNFQGTLQGFGENWTIIEALKGLTVKTKYWECTPNTSSCLWPDLITFRYGNIEISDLAISEPWGGGTATTAYPDTYLASALYVWDQPAELSVDRVSITGAPDDAITAIGGFNLYYAIDYEGAPGVPLTRSLSVRSSSFTTMYEPVYVLNSGSVRVTIGGSPWAGNYFANDFWAVELASPESSVFDVSYNTATATAVDTSVACLSGWQVSQYSIHDNRFTIVGPDGWGIYLSDNSTAPCIAAKVWDNTIKVLPAADNTGINVFKTKNTVITSNTITGTGAHAIGLFDATNGMVGANDVGRFTPTAGGAQIYLDSKTAQDTVVCLHHRDTVHNGGTGNTIIGCTIAP
ncbi:MAG: hypothetical protein ABSG37_04170 [Candidatus Limnocylindrales bacterium]